MLNNGLKSSAPSEVAEVFILSSRTSSFFLYKMIATVEIIENSSTILNFPRSQGRCSGR